MAEQHRLVHWLKQIDQLLSPSRSSLPSHLSSSAKISHPTHSMGQITQPIQQFWQGHVLTASDVAGYVRYHRQDYQRVVIHRCEHYVVVLMCWLPGQWSGCHDHGLSDCLLQIISGTGMDYVCQQGQDSLVQASGEGVLYGPGQLLLTTDQGIHTFGNPASHQEPLVSLHLYCPPLQNSQRYVVRPANTPIAPVWQRWPQSAEKRITVAVVGGGYCGTVAVAQLLISPLARKQPLQILWYEPRGVLGSGVAYGVQDERFLLNVSAQQMGAFAQEPTGFLQWMQQERIPTLQGDAFLPRALYGQYLQHLLQTACLQAPSSCGLQWIPHAVHQIERLDDKRLTLQDAQGQEQVCHGVLLAPGALQACWPQQIRIRTRSQRLIHDPWYAWSMATIASDEPVLLLGSGLTAVDVALWLHRQPRSAPVYLLSRHGLLPQQHLDAQPIPQAIVDWMGKWQQMEEQAPAMRQWVAMLRQQINNHPWPWQLWLDAMRPLHNWLWQQWSLHEQKQWLRHVRSYWEIHRHRMAPRIASQFQSLQQQGKILVQAGRLLQIDDHEQGLQLSIQPRGGHLPIHRTVGWVVHCAGFSSLTRVQPPWLATLLDNQLGQMDCLGMGLEVDHQGQIQPAAQGPKAPLWLAGPLQRGRLIWETTAIPELRQQIQQIVDHMQQIEGMLE